MQVEQSTVLVIEDDPLVLEIIRSNLPLDGWQVEVGVSGGEALTLIEQIAPDVLVLDLMLPEIGGLGICRQVRDHQEPHVANLPILMLTAMAMQSDKLAGFEAGADDYLTKPFDPRELHARLLALIQRVRRLANGPSAPQIELGDLRLNLRKRIAVCADQLLHLKPQEFDLLYAMARRPGEVFTREDLLKEVWNYSIAVDSRTVDIHISRLRRKLKEVNPITTVQIQTVHGVGYTMEAV